MNNKWLDPTGYKTDEEFRRAYESMHSRALAYQELLDLVDGAGNKIEAIKQRMEQVIKPIRL